MYLLSNREKIYMKYRLHKETLWTLLEATTATDKRAFLKISITDEAIRIE